MVSVWCYNVAMRIQKSTDWDQASVPFIAQMHTAPQSFRKDLAKLLGVVTGLVMELSREEIELRRNKRPHSIKQQEILGKIEQAIDNYEQWVLVAHLQAG